MTATLADPEMARLRVERDLYLRLLNLGRQREVEPFLREALAMIVELGEARQAYIEIQDDTDPDGQPRWSLAHGFSDEEVEGVRHAISRGIVAEAIATGDTVSTASALLDPRFGERESVRVGRIQAVLCVPIGQDPPRGVLYLQGRGGAGPFSEEEKGRAEVFARHLAPLVDGLVAKRRSVEAADPTQEVRQRLRLEGVVGRSAALAAVLKKVALVAPLEVSVLLTGESGTGKGQLARVIHDNGPRARDPFVQVNCAALPETLVESELFGALQGAHSTATRRMEGKVAAAERGTLFLDEIGEIPLSVQAKLLQLLQSKEYFPLGSSKPLRADVRLIAATNTDMRRAVAERRFREDLFYRLHVLPVRVPSLAERRADIAELALFLCSTACKRHSLPALEMSRGALRGAECAEWPGNVRQLANAVEAAAIRAAGEGAAGVELHHLFPDSAADADPASPSLTFQEATRQFQARLLGDALEENGWNIVETARRLDLARSHIYNLIRAFGLQRGSK
jgi:transcriptional regulator with GAF, ATPase, and Fis domain